jgi:hypothetical protein
MNSPTTALELTALLDASRAAEPFKDAVRALAERRPQDRIQANSGAPPVKALRVAMKLLEARPDLPLDSLRVRGDSGCSNFTGTATAQPGDVRIDFNWDCKWRAEQEGWTDAFGDADQMRAARQFGYQCFERFEFQNG